MRVGSAKPVFDILQQIKTELISHVRESNYEEFQRIIEPLADTRLADLHFFPVRVAVYSRKSHFRTEKENKGSVLDAQLYIIQKPVRP